MIDLTKNPFNLDAEGVQWVNDTLVNMSEEEKIGQLFCLIAYNDDENLLKYFASNVKAGGLMCRPMPSNQALANTIRILQENSKIPMLIAANLEAGGDGLSVEATRVGTQMQVAAAGGAEYARKLGQVIGKEASALGGNWAFAPVIDIDYNFRNPITVTRTYGSNPKTVRDCGVEYTKAVQSHGVAVSIKHFPGDGRDERDQHLVTSINDLPIDEWDKTYGEAYKASIEAGALTVMIGHIMHPAYTKHFRPEIADKDIMPASLAPELLNDLLREKLGFNGMIVTDASTMNGYLIPMSREKAVPLSIASGCDMYLFTKNLEEDISYMRKGVEEGIITAERLDEAVMRILATKAAIGLHKKSNVPNMEEINKVVGCAEHKAIAAEVASRCITLEKNLENLLPICPKKHKRVLFHPINPGGDSIYMSSAKINQYFMEKLREAGFEVEEFKPANSFEGLFGSYSEVVNKYDLMIYSAALATKSNQTTVRIEWAQPMGANVPMYLNVVPSIFISLENPYHLLDAPRAKTFINTFGSNEAVVDALIKKLLGESEFEGVSPVDAFLGRWDTRL